MHALHAGACNAHVHPLYAPCPLFCAFCAKRLGQHTTNCLCQLSLPAQQGVAISPGHVDAIFNKYGHDAKGRLPIMVRVCCDANCIMQCVLRDLHGSHSTAHTVRLTQRSAHSTAHTARLTRHGSHHATRICTRPITYTLYVCTRTQNFVDALLYGAPRQLMLEHDYVQKGAWQAGQPATHMGACCAALRCLHAVHDAPCHWCTRRPAPVQAAPLACTPAPRAPAACHTLLDHKEQPPAPNPTALLAGKILYPECKKGVWPPSDWNPKLAERSAQLPDTRLELEFVHGYDG